MGILNVTPDSFSDGGRFADLDSAVAEGLRLAESGADIIDVGGESTRPGSDPVPAAEELKRVLPVVEALAQAGLKVSVDTSKATVAAKAVEAGAVMINDISGFCFDEGMWSVARDSGAAVVLCHTRSKPADMQKGALEYPGGVVAALQSYFEERRARAAAEGLAADALLLDPGIGFGKTVAQNIALLRASSEFSRQAPVLIGASRKSFLGRITGRSVDQREAASIAAAALAVESGAAMLRVHDVASSLDAVRLADAWKREKKPATC